MKKISFILALILTIGAVNADNFFQNSNPFPQTEPQKMNNIYESEPAMIQKEAKQAKKSIFRSRNKETQENIEKFAVPVYPVEHEGVESNTKFYMFTTGK